MSAHELTVIWPLYFRARERLRKDLEDLQGSVPPEQFDAEYVGGNSRTFGGGG